MMNSVMGSQCANVCCRRRPADIDGLMKATDCHLQAAAAADQQDVVTSSEPVYELEVVTSPELLTADVKNCSRDDVTSPIYSNVINEHHHHHQQQQQQQQSDLEHVYGEAAPCDEAAYQAVIPADTAADDEYINVSTNRV